MSFEVQQWFLVRRVKAQIATRVNEKMSAVSNQYHRLVGTTMLEGSTPLLLSPELQSHCTSPSDLGPRWGPVDSRLLSSCGLVQQLNMRLISSPFPPTAMSCVVPHWAAHGVKDWCRIQRFAGPAECNRCIVVDLCCNCEACSLDAPGVVTPDTAPDISEPT